MRRLGESERARILEYVGKEPEMNLFFIGDIENYGIDSEIVTIYANETEDRWDFLLLKYYDFYLLYSQNETYDAAAAAEFLQNRTVDTISAKASLLRQLIPFFPDRFYQETQMCRCGADDLKAFDRCFSHASTRNTPEISCTSSDLNPSGHLCTSEKLGDAGEPCDSGKSNDSGKRRPSGKRNDSGELCLSSNLHNLRNEHSFYIRALSVADLDAMLQLLLQIEEFSHTYQHPDKARQQLAQELQSGELAVGAFEGDRLISIAKTSASNSKSAMLTGVATLPDRRGQGCASAVVHRLCLQSFQAGREFLCLFYDNPKAGRIYRRIGFREIGGYGMLK